MFKINQKHSLKRNRGWRGSNVGRHILPRLDACIPTFLLFIRYQHIVTNFWTYLNSVLSSNVIE